ncbi:mannitol dehydrogenase family protein [Roseibium sp. SCPC15]|uniref:mannitol dehydrogenase family protein n=1 Tax=Roseibium sp. SCP15 TaxID=3141376 RepID=UPI00333BEE54
MPTTPIVQFGTSRFLQAHADLFISEALQEGRALGRIAVVQSSGDASRASRLQALADPAGYSVQVKGVDEGELVDTSKTVGSIARGLSLPSDLAEVTDLIKAQARIIISNTADAGFRPQQADAVAEFSQHMSYPAKLAWFLFQRFTAGGNPIQVMPAELIPQNGAVLRDLVLSIAQIYPEEFRAWLQSEVLWVNSLVDRIVSEPLEPAGAVAEPYALWAIENQPGLIVPCEHRDVRVVDDLEQVETLKLYILNLGHTYMVSRWLTADTASRQFVREVIEDDVELADLKDMYMREVVPAFAAQGRGEEAEAYVKTTIDRFRNPFLDHRFSDIAQNHAEKVDRRIDSFLKWARASDPDMQMPRLEAVVGSTISG